MKIQPIATPQAAQAPAGTNSQSSQDARARAIAALTQQPAEQVVQSQNNVQPEELGAVKTQSHQTQDQVVEPKAESDESPASEVEKKSEDPLSSQYALLARREKAIRAKAQQQEQAFKAREEALKAREQALEAKGTQDLSQYVSKARLKANPMAALEEAQVTYDEITQAAINSQNPLDPRVQSMLERQAETIAKLEAAIEQGQKGQAEQQTQAYQAAVKQIETDVKALVKTDPAFEAVRATNSISDVVELIERTYKEEGTLLGVEEAAQLVEDHLLAEIDKLTKIEKVKSRLSPKPAAQSETQAQSPSKPPQQQQPMKTLTNANSSTRQLTARERALLAFKGEKIG